MECILGLVLHCETNVKENEREDFSPFRGIRGGF